MGGVRYPSGTSDIFGNYSAFCQEVENSKMERGRKRSDCLQYNGKEECVDSKTLQDEMGVDLGFRDGFPLKLIMIMIVNTLCVRGSGLGSVHALTRLISSKISREVLLSVFSFHI